MAPKEEADDSLDDASAATARARPAPLQDILFCPYCGQMSFRVGDTDGESVYCEFCGVDVAIDELVKVV